MQVIAVDDERIALEHLTGRLRQCSQISGIESFQSSEDALKWAEGNNVDTAFLDIELGDLYGIDLARRIKILHPKCSVVFVTGYSEYALEAFSIHASGYLMKPVRVEDIQKELEFISKPLDLNSDSVTKIQIYCFGNFEVFADGIPLKLKYKRSRELLAYLVDRKGAFCEVGELCAVLWEDRPDSKGVKSQLRHFVADLISALKSVGCEDVIIKKRGAVAVVPDKVDCDYYRWLKGDIKAINSYAGEYMSQYSWGEMTTGLLDRHM